MSSALPSAVLWDMDGTLVDTEPYWMEAETALVESFGGTWTHEQALTLVGQGLETSGAILQEAGVRMSVADIIAHLTAEVTRLLSERGNPLRPGAHELLTALRGAGIRCALVTMSMRRMASQVVAPFPELFEIIVAGDDVTRPKPFPDAYLQACRALGIDPADAVAIEDSPTGVRAAVAAGVTTIGVPLMVSLVGTGAHTVWPTLAGRTPEDIAAVHAAHRTHRTGEHA
ncbi:MULTISPECIES: HAD family hydrolase [Microbacterium]|uniref:Phosphorylated carbohydrates phosphatase n=2 Tax=Microbacterium TaxID=33882 RepID=A0A150HBT8_9MICO|nr:MULTISPECIES: HAD family phosphatase [Microbacterium]KIC57412.1 hydrolase [Microbacterium hominis]KXZ59485.1 Phosphorylated carbohydrates phosphatase [Microbacterium laevaniformans]